MVNIPVIDMAATGDNIRSMRVQSGLSVKDLQNIFGFTNPQAIYKWQQGSAMPTIDNIAILAAIFGVRIDDIIVFQKCELKSEINAESYRDLNAELNRDLNSILENYA